MRAKSISLVRKHHLRKEESTRKRNHLLCKIKVRLLQILSTIIISITLSSTIPRQLQDWCKQLVLLDQHLNRRVTTPDRQLSKPMQHNLLSHRIFKSRDTRLLNYIKIPDIEDKTQTSEVFKTVKMHNNRWINNSKNRTGNKSKTGWLFWIITASNTISRTRIENLIKGLFLSSIKDHHLKIINSTKEVNLEPEN